MKVCIVHLEGVKYKETVTSNSEINENLIEDHLSKQRVFHDLSKAVNTIREEEKKNGLKEYWTDEWRDEITDEVDSVYLFFKDGYDSYTIEKSYYLDIIEVE